MGQPTGLAHGRPLYRKPLEGFGCTQEFTHPRQGRYGVKISRGSHWSVSDPPAEAPPCMFAPSFLTRANALRRSSDQHVASCRNHRSSKLNALEVFDAGHDQRADNRVR